MSDKLLELVCRFKGMQQEHLRYVVFRNKIKDVSEFVWIPRNVLIGKGCGERFFLEFKKTLLELGHPYDSDSLNDIQQKIIERKEKVYNPDALLKLRFKILERDGFTCQYCGRSPKTDRNVKLQVDHIDPLSKGGDWDEGNLTTSCQECNVGKGDCILKAREEK